MDVRAEGADAPVANGIDSAQLAPVSPAPAEKMVSQSKLEEILSHRLHQKENRLRGEYEGKIADLQRQVEQQQQPVSNMGGMEQPSRETIQRMIEDETKRQQERLSKEYVDYINAQQAQELVSRFTQKIEAGKGKYSDFDTKVAQLQLNKIPAIVQLADSVDNTADVMYELAENPHKIANILSLASNPDTAHIAHMQMQRLSDSIKTNEAAKNAGQANSPLSRISPSNAGTDNGKMGVRDLRKQSWMKA